MPEPVAYADLERLSDTELVARAREALPEADLETAKRCVALVYERHRMLVRAVCAGKASPQLVDDLEASVYERFVRVAYLAREPIANPAGLLMVMTRRVLASHYARAEPPHTGVDVLGDVAVDDPSDAEAEEAVEQLLSVLSPRQRDVVRLRVFKEWSGEEIAERLETTRGNVDVIFHRAMRKLQEAVER
jgi:RNA polymerase sigma factor (sigma-70 family)